MEKLTLKQKIVSYWKGLKLKPSRMKGNSSKYAWVVASAHPLYSITWTWAIYWYDPFRSPTPTTWRWFFYYSIKYGRGLSKFTVLGFSIQTQDVMYYN